MQIADFLGALPKGPEKSLLAPLTHSGGRNNRGRMTSRHRGGGHKRRMRIIDFRRNHDGVAGVVAALEYDPNRSANLALIHYADGLKSYILAPEGLSVGDKVESGPEADIKPGNALPLKSIPVGTIVHAIEMKPGAGAQLSRGAGTQTQLMAKEGKMALLKLPSGEQRMVLAECRATIGQVGNVEHENISIGKARRRSRWLGKHGAGTYAASRWIRWIIRTAAAVRAVPRAIIRNHRGGSRPRVIKREVPRRVRASSS